MFPMNIMDMCVCVCLRGYVYRKISRIQKNYQTKTK